MTENLKNINIERSILSSIIFDPALYEGVASKLKPEDFYLPFHKELFSAMETLERGDQPIDEEFLKLELSKNKKFDENLFFDIVSTNPISNTSAYMDELKELAIKRDLIRLTSDIKELTIDQELPSEDVLDSVQARLYSITQDHNSKEFRDAPEMIQSALEHIEELKKRGNSLIVGLDTGFSELNRMTSGFGQGDLIIIAARPAMGKTAFVLNLAQNVLNQNRGVAIFSLEMPAEQLVMRMLSARTSIPLQKLRIGDLNDEEWSNFSAASDSLSEKKLFVDDGGLVNIHQVRSKLRKLKSQHPEIELCIIDYLQLMSGGGGKDRHLEVSEISRGLKLLARELDMPIIALSQLNRGLESRNDKRPMLSDLRESGAIEQDADIIMFVYRDDVYRIREEKEKEKKAAAEGKEYKSNFREKPEEDAEIIIGKQRNGPTGIVDMVFQKRFTRFVDKTETPIEIVYENIDTTPGKIELPPI
jgi:replicative DNA helicase